MTWPETKIISANPTVAELETGGYQCTDQTAKGIDWHVRLMKATVDDKDMLRVTVRGTINNNNNNTTSSWRASIQPEIFIYNKDHEKTKKESPRQEIDGNTTCAVNVFDWAYVIHPSMSGIICPGRMCLIIELTVFESTFNTVTTRKRKMDYETKSQITDFALVVEGQKIYIGRQFLASFSPFFTTLFYGDFAEKEKDEIELKDVNYEDFMVLLEILYADQKIEYSNVEGVLKLADQFEVKLALTRAESFLESSSLPLSKKLLLSDRYGLTSLKNDCLRKLSDKQAVRDLAKSAEYQELDNDVKVKILENLL